MRALLVAVMVLLAACAGEAADGTTSTVPVEPPSTTSTTVVEATTTTEAAGPVGICGRGVVWEPETTYSADCFIVPVWFEPEDEGWRSVGGGLQWLEVFWVDSELNDPAARFALWAYRSSDSPRAVIESILSIDGVSALTEVGGTKVSGRDAVGVDVETEIDEFNEADTCSLSNLGLRTWDGDIGQPGYFLFSVGDGTFRLDFGLGACKTFRLWAFEVEDFTVTIAATSDEDERFDELMPTIERLLDSMTFEAP